LSGTGGPCLVRCLRHELRVLMHPLEGNSASKLPDSSFPLHRQKRRCDRELGACEHRFGYQATPHTLLKATMAWARMSSRPFIEVPYRGRRYSAALPIASRAAAPRAYRPSAANEEQERLPAGLEPVTGASRNLTLRCFASPISLEKEGFTVLQSIDELFTRWFKTRICR
jgi:hypothetical protein